MGHRVRAVLVALLLLGGWALAPAAGAATPADPRAELVQARSELAGLAGQARSAAARQALDTASGVLAGATAGWLWIDRFHLIAPGHGGAVFADSRAALRGLERIAPGSVSAAGLAAAEASILRADRTLAVFSILQARGGAGGLLKRAAGMILSGDRWAATSRVDLAAEQYGAGWRDAFQALTRLVLARVTFASPAAVGSGALRALTSGSRIRPAGVHVLHGRTGLARAGKPEVLFIGTEGCPSCAIERWGMAVALSQFGLFSNLALGQSAVGQGPFVRSFTFAGAVYRSPYVSFVPVEVSSDAPAPGGGFQRLGRLTAAQRGLFRALDSPGSVPFIDVANQFADVGATVSPSFGAGLAWSGLAAAPDRPGTAAGQAIAASAEVLTAEICQATGGLPAPVCQAAAVREYSGRLAGFGGRGGACPVALRAGARTRMPSLLSARAMQVPTPRREG